MKKCLCSTIIGLILVLLSVLCTACGTTHCSLKPGMYGFELAIIKNKLTQKTTEKSVDDILDSGNELREWGNLLGFQIYVNDDTEYIRTKDGRYSILDEGLAFEVVAENTLRLHFPN